MFADGRGRKRILAALILAWLTSGRGAAAPVQEWEYLKLLNDPKVLSLAELNRLGERCWQPVVCPPDSSEKGPVVYSEDTLFRSWSVARSAYCIFKRRSPVGGAITPCIW